MWRLSGVCGVFAWSTVVLCLAAAPPATASGWSILPTPNPLFPSTELSAVSCTSVTACTAVGDYTNPANREVTLAERWDGKTWTKERSRSPFPAYSVDTSSKLSSVSCTPDGACTAVGSDGGGGLIEHWNGSAWSIQKPIPYSQPSVVSCGSATSCVAIDGGVQRWNGRRWSDQVLPVRPDASDIWINGVSCPSASACTAVGSFDFGPGCDEDFGKCTTRLLVERWNGSRWSQQRAPDPAGAIGPSLSSVSCSSTTVCTATGSFANAPESSLAFAERWNGSRWATQSMPNPTGAGSAIFSAVSCSSGGDCTAIGSFTISADHQVALVERWNGSRWSMQRIAKPRGVTAIALSGVSCPSKHACFVVGNITAGGVRELPAVVELWHG